MATLCAVAAAFIGSSRISRVAYGRESLRPGNSEVFMSILCAAPSQDFDDVGIVLGLLKGALAAERGHRTSHRPAMAEVGRMLLARA